MGKFVSVILILIGGGAVSCGGNFILFFVLLFLGFGGAQGEGYGSSLIGYLLIFWILELFGILFYAINKTSSQGKHIQNLQDKNLTSQGDGFRSVLLIVLFIVTYMTVSMGFGLLSGLIDMSGSPEILTYFGPLIPIIISILIFNRLKIIIPSSILERDISTDISIKNTKKSETLDLMNSLIQVDISNVESIKFITNGTKGFIIKTPNIKRLAIYITTKLAKTTFEAEELRNIYNHVVENLQSNLSKTDYNIVQGKINEFVQSGGEVKIEKTNS